MAWYCPRCDQLNSNARDECVCGFNHGKVGDTDVGTKLCGSCGKKMPLEDKFCPFCGGRDVTLTWDQKEKIQKAAKWIFAIAIMFVIAGTLVGFLQKNIAEKAKKSLAQYDDSHVWETPINGEKYTVGELKASIDKEVLFVFLTNYFLAIVMFVLYLWARRSPFPAMVTALCVYLSVIVLNGILDPKTIGQGVVIKTIFIIALIAGIKASLAARSAVRT